VNAVARAPLATAPPAAGPDASLGTVTALRRAHRKIGAPLSRFG